MKLIWNNIEFDSPEDFFAFRASMEEDEAKEQEDGDSGSGASDGEG